MPPPPKIYREEVTYLRSHFGWRVMWPPPPRKHECMMVASMQCKPFLLAQFVVTSWMLGNLLLVRACSTTEFGATSANDRGLYDCGSVHVGSLGTHALATVANPNDSGITGRHLALGHRMHRHPLCKGGWPPTAPLLTGFVSDHLLQHLLRWTLVSVLQKLPRQLGRLPTGAI